MQPYHNSFKLPGVITTMDWDRKYPYGDTLRGIFGDVSTSTEGIPKELTEQYLSKRLFTK